MSVLVLGQGPLPLVRPDQQNLRTNAPGLRTWHFACALQQAGEQVTIVVLDQSAPQVGTPKLAQTVAPGLDYYLVPSADIIQNGFLSQLCAEVKPKCVVAASIFPAYLAALYLPPELPLWADFFGSPLAEGQAKAFVYKDDSLITPYASYERVVAQRADAFSTVSSYQKYALVGALATHGRFNQASYGHDFVHVIPASVTDEILPHTQTVLRGQIAPEDAFIVLWSGGYNTWTDVETLFKGLSGAMATLPNLHFVSTGGGLPPHDEKTYNDFCQLVAASPYQERFHLLGWLPLAILHNYYYEADVGIILDKWSYEGVLGSRTRLLDWLKYGLPSITTVTAELTEILVKQDFGFSFPHDDNAALTALLGQLAQQKTTFKTKSTQASQWILENYSYTQVCKPLVEWVQTPHHAPDAGQVLNSNNGETSNNIELERQLASLTSQLEQKNAHIAAIETWAHDMENRLKTKPFTLGYLNKARQFGSSIFNNKRDDSHKK
jgi:glycosyltransferase involved in cell wall biosynthesis